MKKRLLALLLISATAASANHCFSDYSACLNNAASASNTHLFLCLINPFDDGNCQAEADAIYEQYAALCDVNLYVCLASE